MLVHSDPSFARLEESLGARIASAVPVRYTGFVHGGGQPPAWSTRIRPGSIVVSAGGGMVGETLLRCAVDAHALIPLAATYERPLGARVNVVWRGGVESRDSNDPDKRYLAPALTMTLRYRWR